jgi:hypothetical protein
LGDHDRHDDQNRTLRAPHAVSSQLDRKIRRGFAFYDPQAPEGRKASGRVSGRRRLD